MHLADRSSPCLFGWRRSAGGAFPSNPTRCHRSLTGGNRLWRVQTRPDRSSGSSITRAPAAVLAAGRHRARRVRHAVDPTASRAAGAQCCSDSRCISKNDSVQRQLAALMASRKLPRSAGRTGKIPGDPFPRQCPAPTLPPAQQTNLFGERVRKGGSVQTGLSGQRGANSARDIRGRVPGLGDGGETTP